MDKIYITKTNLNEVLTNYKRINEDYPKPVLVIIAAFLTAMIAIISFFIFLLVIVAILLYALLFWVDIVIGKYIIKGILKL
jgi:hypothetical protein